MKPYSNSRGILDIYKDPLVDNKLSEETKDFTHVNA